VVELFYDAKLFRHFLVEFTGWLGNVMLLNFELIPAANIRVIAL
jgi:hypothetical protein